MIGCVVMVGGVVVEDGVVVCKGVTVDGDVGGRDEDCRVDVVGVCVDDVFEVDDGVSGEVGG